MNEYAKCRALVLQTVSALCFSGLLFASGAAFSQTVTRQSDFQPSAVLDRTPFGIPPAGNLSTRPGQQSQATTVDIPKPPELLPSTPKSLQNGNSGARPLVGAELQRALQELEKAKAAELAAAKPAPADPSKKVTTDKKASETATMAAAVSASPEDGKTPTPADPALPAAPQAMFNGSFTQSIPIDVPAFRGYEPKLKLVYDSNHGSRSGGHNPSWVGHGWHLEGLSEIVRVSPRRGAPQFNATDTWTLDGEELLACVAGMESPSCQNGGTHAARVENYRRMAYDSASNQWRVTRPDGSYDVLVPVGNFGGSGSPSNNHSYFYRYVVFKSVDPNGNEVTFGYTCQTLPACTVSTITYGPTTILLRSEVRPDPIEMAVGGAMMTVTQRLKLIDVVVSGARARAYQLSYDQSPSTGASRLVSVRQYGKNAVIDANNTVTSGDALPPHVFTYQGTAVQPTVASASQKIALPTRFGGYDFSATGMGAYFIDHNGNGKSDIASAHDYPGSYIEGSGNPNLVFETCIDTASSIGNYPAGYSASVNHFIDQCRENNSFFFKNVGDFDGDGKEDVLLTYYRRYVASGEDATVYYNTYFVLIRDGQAPVTQAFRYDFQVENITQITTGDFDGDGKTQVLVLNNSLSGGQPGTLYWDAYSLKWNGSQFVKTAIGVPQTPGSQNVSRSFRAGDFDGDGKTDILEIVAPRNASTGYVSSFSTEVARFV